MHFIDLICQSHKNKQVLIGGHRGHLSDIRENTVENFEALARSEIRYIEIDIQLTRDNEAVIFHDRELSEKTPLSGHVRDYTVQELKAAFELNTLDEALFWCKNNRMFALLEIKSKDYTHEERVILARRITDMILFHQFQNDCIPLSIDHEILRLIKNALPEIRLALIVPEKPEDPIGLMKSMQASIWLSYLEDMDKELVFILHRAGYYVDGSVVNDEKKLIQAIEMDVDMIESDYPFEVLRSYKEKTQC